MASDHSNFHSPPQRLVFGGLLFDMDGTIIDSTNAIVKHWHSIGKELGVDANVVLETSHGRRSIDVLRLVRPEKATWEYTKQMEARLPQLYGSDAVEIPGARKLLDSMSAQSHIPWAIVTSGTSPLLTGWLNVLKLPRPECIVVAEDVENGKPDPECYLLGKQKLGLEGQAKVLVLEDSPAGIKAGKSAGCKVLAVTTTHTIEQVVEAGADYVVRDLSSIKFVGSSPEGIALEITDALEMNTSS